MAIISQTITWTPKILGIQMTTQGLTFEVQFSQPGRPPSPAVKFVINAADNSVRDPLGGLLYPDYSVLAPGLLAAATGCWAQVNTIFAQAITDAKVVPQ